MTLPDSEADSGIDWSEGPIINPVTDSMTKPTPLVAQMIELATSDPGALVGIETASPGSWKSSPKINGIRRQLVQFAPHLYLRLTDVTVPDGTRMTCGWLSPEPYGG